MLNRSWSVHPTSACLSSDFLFDTRFLYSFLRQACSCLMTSAVSSAFASLVWARVSGVVAICLNHEPGRLSAQLWYVVSQRWLLL